MINNNKGTILIWGIQLLMRYWQRDAKTNKKTIGVYYYNGTDFGRQEELDDGQMLIGCSGRGVNQEVIRLAPVHVSEELLDQP
jgi:hypothetical protein